MSDILDDLRDLKKQATTERSHYYVAKCCDRAIAEIERLQRVIDGRPAINAALPESYIKWSQQIYEMEAARVLGLARS